MEIFKNKFLVKLIATICLMLALFNFTVTTKSYATTGDDELWGGVLLNPIISLLTSIGDIVMEILHDSVNSQEMALIEINGERNWFWSIIGPVLVILATCAFIAVAVSLSGGIAAIIAKLAGETVKIAFVHAAAHAAGGAVLGGIVAGVVTGVAVKEKMIPEDINLPAFTITAEQIFRNEIALFDVNFFKPNYYYIEKNVQKDLENVELENDDGTTLKGVRDYVEDVMVDGGWFEGYDAQREISVGNAKDESCKGYESFQLLIGKINEKLPDGKKKISDDMTIYVYDRENSHSSKGANWTDQNYKFDIIDNNEVYIRILYTASATINAGTVITTYVDTLNYLILEGEEEYDTVKVEIESTAAQLREIVSTWYFILRNVALLVLMLLLIYLGIRIVIGSTAGEKAKYKERLMDWLVAVCLIFIMHYIMVFAVEIVEKITGLVGQTVNGNMAYISLTKEQEESAKEKLADYDTTGEGSAIAYPKDNNGNELSSNGVLVWPTDLAGLFRIESQITESGTTTWAGYSLCYVVLVLFTLFFSFTYLRRVLYMAFLTMIAPLVAMTYPIDKITDGKAQAFDSWLKEYIFNLMIQPLHLLLYTVLVSSAFKLATESPIYALVAVGFMMPAEKLMRRFFGFEKAKTPGLLGGAAGAAIAMTGLQSIMKKHPNGKHGSGGSNEKEKDDIVTKDYSSSEGVSTMDTLAGIETGGARDEATDDKEPEEESTEEGRRLAIGREARERAEREERERRARAAAEEAAKIAKEREAKAKETIEGVYRAGADGARIVEEEDREREAAEVTDRERAVRKRISSAKAARKKAEKTGKATGKRSLARTLSGVAGEYGRQLGKRTLKRVANGRPIRALAKGVTGLAGGALFGLTGLALGVASGDASKTFQYTSAGLVGGYAAGSGLAGATADVFEVDNEKAMEREIERSWYGEDYEKIKYDEAIENDLMSDKNINYLRDTYNWSRGEAKEFLDTIGRDCYGSGVRNVEEMAAIGEVLDVKDEKTGLEPTIEEAIAATKLKKSLPSKVKDMRDDKLDKYKETYTNAFAKKIAAARGLSEDDAGVKEDAKARTDYTIRLMKSLEKASSSLSEV